MDNLTLIFSIAANTTREAIPESVRRAILQAYDFDCQHCLGRGMASCVDHIIPVKLRTADIQKLAHLDLSYFPDNLNALENFTASCQACNIGKSNKLISIDKIERLLDASKRAKPLIEMLSNVGYAYRPDIIPRSELDRQTLDAPSFMQACIIGDVNKIAEAIKSNKFASLYDKALEAAIFFGKQEASQALSSKAKMTWNGIRQIINSVPKDMLNIEHFKIISDPDINKFESIHRYDISQFQPFDYKFLAIYCACKLDKKEIYFQLVKEEINQTIKKKLSTKEYEFIDAAIFSDFEYIEHNINDLHDPEICSLALSFALRRAAFSDNYDSKECIKILSKQQNIFESDKYKLLILALEESKWDPEWFDKAPFSRISRKSLNDSLAYMLLISKTYEPDKFINILLDAGAELDLNHEYHYQAVEFFCAEPIRTYGAGINRYEWPRMNEDRNRYLNSLERLSVFISKEHAQSILKAVLRRSYAPSHGDNRSFKQDFYEKKLVDFLTRQGADISLLQDTGFLWACAFGDVRTVCSFNPKKPDARILRHALRMAARNQHHDVCKALVDMGAEFKNNTNRQKSSQTENEIFKFITQITNSFPMK